MHVEQVRFDRVFDVQAMNGMFSFESGGRVRYGVILPDEAVPAVGDRLTIVFGEAGNWSTVLGWFDPATGKLALRYRIWGMVWTSFSVLARVLPLALVLAATMFGKHVVLALAGLALCGIAAGLGRALHLNRRVRQVLRACADR